MIVLTVWVDIISPDTKPAGYFRFLFVQALYLNSGMSGIIYYVTLPDFKKQ